MSLSLARTSPNFLRRLQLESVAFNHARASVSARSHENVVLSINQTPLGRSLASPSRPTPAVLSSTAFSRQRTTFLIGILNIQHDRLNFKKLDITRVTRIRYANFRQAGLSLSPSRDHRIGRWNAACTSSHEKESRRILGLQKPPARANQWDEPVAIERRESPTEIWSR